MNIEYTTENKDYKLIINRTLSKFTNNYIYTFKIYNIINTKLLEFNFSYIDLLNIIDIIEEFLSNDIDIYYSINCNNNIYIIGLYQLDTDVLLIHKLEDFYNKDIFSISTYNNDIIVKILSFEVTTTLKDILEILYQFI